jgi:DNA-binding SARP family transcriptional activator
VLGSFEVRVAGQPVPLGGEKQRALLAILALRANDVVAREWLLEELWADDPPATAVKALQVYVSRLRKVLPAGALVTRPPGYVLEIDPEQVDVHRFERIVTEAGDVDPAQASVLLRSALALWRGPPFSEFGDEPFARIEAARLEDLHLAALKDLIDADLALGRHRALIPELRRLIERHPYRERLRGQLMIALYRSGRQAEALDAYQAARSVLDKVGLEPGTALRTIERQILTQDPILDLAEPAPLARGIGGRALLPGPLVPASPVPFVGRETELAMLRSLLDRAVDGEGGLALLVAEAGAGKTRLVREFAREAADEGVLVLYGASDVADTATYQPLLDWFAFLLRACDENALNALTGGGESLPRLVSELTGANEGLAESPGDAAAERYRLETAVTNLLARMSRVQSLLLVFDDVQWSDTETLHLLRALGRTAPEGRILVIAALRELDVARETVLGETLADLSRLDGVTHLTVRRLDTDDVGAFVRAATGTEPSPELVSEIAAAANGNPAAAVRALTGLRLGHGQAMQRDHSRDERRSA